MALDAGHVMVNCRSLTLGDQLGRGSSGTVTHAQDPATGLIVALKVVPITLRTGAEQVVAQLSELYRSTHPNVASFHGADYDAQHQSVLIAFEYMDCKSLKDILQRCPGRRIPEPVMGNCAGQVIAGMVYLHGTRRLIHRDIKPSNVLLNSGGMFKIADFGMSKELSDTMSAGQTWVGTSSYMSPERVMGINYSFNADIWSLGIIVYECCTGQAPFGGAQTYELLDNIVDKEPPALPEDFSNEARHFVSLCLTKDQESRPGSDQLLQHPFILVNQAAPVVQWLTSL